MEELARGRAAYAVLPVENSSAGIIPEISDLLVEYGHCIVGEQVLRIDHALLDCRRRSIVILPTFIPIRRRWRSVTLICGSMPHGKYTV